MGNFFNQLTPGVSSNTALSQSDSPEGFKLINPNGPRPVTVTNQLEFGSEFVQASVQQQFQQSQLRATQDKLRTATSQKSSGLPEMLATPGANPYGVKRDPWIFATFKDVVSGELTASTQNAIVWYANPKSVEWSIGQRGTEAKTKAGTVLHMWRDKARKTDYDDPKITMTFQSGNIMPGFQNAMDASTLQGPPNTPVSQGLNNFYQFMQLVDASKITNGQANLIHILYKSRIFPSMMITGFFDPQTVVKFSDNSDDPFKISGWSSTFTIYQTVPAFNNWSKLKEMFEQEFRNGDPLNQSIAGSVSTGGIPDQSKFNGIV